MNIRILILQATFEFILHYGSPFIFQNDKYRNSSGKWCSPLTELAIHGGYHTGKEIDIVEKAILLLSQEAEVSCQDENGDAVLHTLLKCDRYHEHTSNREGRRDKSHLEQWKLSHSAPNDLLMAFITAGADVYATNNDGKSPSMVATDYRRKKDWIQALERCGYSADEVIFASCPNHEARVRQISKLSFDQYCRDRKTTAGWFEEIETFEVDEEDNEQNRHQGTEQTQDDSLSGWNGICKECHDNKGKFTGDEMERISYEGRGELYGENVADFNLHDTSDDWDLEARL